VVLLWISPSQNFATRTTGPPPPLHHQVNDIAGIMLEGTAARLRDRGIALTVTPAFRDLLVTRGFNPTYGARPLRRAITAMLEVSPPRCRCRRCRGGGAGLQGGKP